MDGQRVKKTAPDLTTGELVTTEYFYNGDILAGQKKGNDTIIFMYDNNGDIFGFTYNGTPYYYVKNAQNDVVFIVDETNHIVVYYEYDAWGKVIYCNDTSSFGLASINPIMYRSYYVDLEMGMYIYYLNSRYYVADWGRFASADSYVQTGQGMLDKNMFAYCGNNPICYSDPQGTSLIGSILVLGGLVCGMVALLSGCSPSPPKDYKYNDTNSQNCYSYAFDLQGYANPGDYSSNENNSRFSCEDTYTVDEIADWVMRDMNYLDKSVRVVSSPKDKKENEKIVALKVVLTTDPVRFDYHFAVQLSNGHWADKLGPLPSRYDKIDGYAISWEINEYRTYNSETVYFAVGV